LPALTRAAFLLTPVAIDFGPQFPRLSAFVDSIESDGDRHALVLGPVSADAIPRVPGAAVTIQATRGSDLWVLTAERLEATGTRTARVELAGASLAPLARRRSARTDATGREPLVLAVPSGTEELDGCVFPLSGLGASHCIVDATIPLPPGARFDPVEVIG